MKYCVTQCQENSIVNGILDGLLNNVKQRKKWSLRAVSCKLQNSEDEKKCDGYFLVEKGALKTSCRVTVKWAAGAVSQYAVSKPFKVA